MRNSRKKKRREEKGKREEAGEEEERVVRMLVEAFGSVSVEEAKAAYDEANGDANRAVEMLTRLCAADTDTLSGVSDSGEVGTSCSSSSGGSGLGSSSSEGTGRDGNGFVLGGGGNNREFRGNRGKKMVAATGMVSNLLGKGYAVASSRTELRKTRGWSGGRIGPEEAEQFLCCMLGDECDVAVVKDVLGHCSYDVEKALDVLLDLYASSSESCANGRCSSSNSSSREDSEHGDYMTDRGYDSTSHSSERDAEDYAQMLDYNYRNYLEALLSSRFSGERYSTSQTDDKSELALPEEVLRSLFNIPESSQRDPGSMNWKNVVKQVESFAQKRVELYPPGTAGTQHVNCAKGTEYQALREPARHQWDSVKSYYQQAAAANSNGARQYASYLSEQAKLRSKTAQKEDEKASMEIFNARNKDRENVLTIDLHGQHVKQAIRLVKLHLLFGTYISSVQYLRVITGCGNGGLGKSKLKESVISLLDRETIQWKEENRGTVIIRLDGLREFSFLDSGSDSD